MASAATGASLYARQMFPVELQMVDLLVGPMVRLAAGLLRTSLLVRQQRNHAKLCQIAGGWLALRPETSLQSRSQLGSCPRNGILLQKNFRCG